MHAHPQFGNILCGALLPSVMRRESQLGVLPVVKDSISEGSKALLLSLVCVEMLSGCLE